MNIRALFITAIVLVIVMVVVVVQVLWSDTEVVPPIETSVTPTFPVGQFPPSSLYSENTIDIPTAEGAVEVRNFLTDGDVVADLNNPGYYRLGQESTSASMFEISYIAQTGHFTISLLQSPLESARRAAEVELMRRLAVDEEGLCALRYSVAVPGYVNEAASGTDYGFSFCPDGLPIPYE